VRMRAIGTHGVPFAPCVHLPYGAHHVATWHMLQRNATRCNAMQLVAPRWPAYPLGRSTLGSPLLLHAGDVWASACGACGASAACVLAAKRVHAYFPEVGGRWSSVVCVPYVAVWLHDARCKSHFCALHVTRYMSSVACRPLHVVAGLTGWQEPELDESDAEEPADGAPHPSSAPFAHHCGLDWPTVRICAGADLTAPCGPSQIRPPRPPTPPRQPSVTRTRRRSRFWSIRFGRSRRLSWCACARTCERACVCCCSMQGARARRKRRGRADG
jgi:hypothetical protein